MSEEKPMTVDEKKEIIAIMVNRIIYSGAEALAAVKLYNGYEKLISKAEVRLMVNFDMGRNWERLLDQPVIFYFDENDKPKWSLEFKKYCRNQLVQKCAYSGGKRQ